MLPCWAMRSWRLGHLIAAVLDRLDRRSMERSPAAEIARANASWRAKWEAKLEATTAPINPYRVIAEFQQVVDTADVIMTHDSGSPREQLLPFYQAKRPRGYLGWGKSHQLGTGLGLNIGAKIAAPEKFCVNIMGDAAFGMTGLDFETAVRCGVPILTIVFNNSSMAIETRHMGLSHEKYPRARPGWQLCGAGARPWRLERTGGAPRDRSARRSCARAGRPRRAGPVCSSSSPTRRRRSRKATMARP